MATTKRTTDIQQTTLVLKHVNDDPMRPLALHTQAGELISGQLAVELLNEVDSIPAVRVTIHLDALTVRGGGQ